MPAEFADKGRRPLRQQDSKPLLRAYLLTSLNSYVSHLGRTTALFKGRYILSELCAFDKRQRANTYFRASRIIYSVRIRHSQYSLSLIHISEPTRLLSISY